MIIYENKGLSFVPQKWWNVINIQTILLAILALFTLETVIWINLRFLSISSVCFTGLSLGIYIYYISKIAPRIIEINEMCIKITYSVYFSIQTIEIKCKDIKVEFYESPYKCRNGELDRYLYFYSTSDKKIDIGLNGSIQTFSRILRALQEIGKVTLSSKESNIIFQSNKDSRPEQTETGKYITLLLLAFIVSLFIALQFS